MRESTPCSCDPALVAALRERARIVAMLHREADQRERDMGDPRKSDVRTSLLAAAISLRAVADRIERGEA